MLKTAIYGLAVTFSKCRPPGGVVLLAFGLSPALFGVVFATVQVDMKRLLAYSSIPGISGCCAAIGLTLLFKAYGMFDLAARPLPPAFTMLWSTPSSKSLFVGTGAVLHAHRGAQSGGTWGLIQTMPWVAWLVFVGVFASSGPPPLSGFVSEWLLLQVSLFTAGAASSFLNMFHSHRRRCHRPDRGPGRLCHGEVLRNRLPRPAPGREIAGCHDAGPWGGWAWPGWQPGYASSWGYSDFRDPAHRPGNRSPGRVGPGPSGGDHRLVVAGPTSIERASYGPVFFPGRGGRLLAIRLCPRPPLLPRPAAPCRSLDCGHPWQTPAWDTAEGFSQPIRQIFEPFFGSERHLPSSFDRGAGLPGRGAGPFSGIGSTCRWPGAWNSLAAQVGRLQRDASPSICFTAS